MRSILEFIMHVVAASLAAVSIVLLFAAGLIGVMQLAVGPYPDPRPSERFMAAPDRSAEYRAMHEQGARP